MRDAEATLPATLASVRRQTETRFECWIVDDGSRDGTPALVRAAVARDERFRVLTRPAQGLVTALNEGLARCRAPLVARMDADDLMHSRRLELQRLALEREPRLAGVGCHVRIFPRRGLRAGLRDYEAWLRTIDSPRRVREEALVECPLPHPTWMLRREVFARLGYRDRGWPEDYDLLLRMLEAGEELGVVPRRLLAWREHPGRLWRNDAAYAQERFLACKAEHLARGFLAGCERYGLWGYGETGKALRRALEQHGKRPGHIVELHPGRLGETIHGAPVVRPEALPAQPRLPLVVSVAGAVARTEIRATLARLGWRELVDYVCAA